jgi:hypothetical protein
MPHGGKRGPVIRIRIQYDKYNRTFKLLDSEFGSLLADGDVYELPVSLREFCHCEETGISAQPDAPIEVAAVCSVSE